MGIVEGTGVGDLPEYVGLEVGHVVGDTVGE